MKLIFFDKKWSKWQLYVFSSNGKLVKNVKLNKNLGGGGRLGGFGKNPEICEEMVRKCHKHIMRYRYHIVKKT